MRLNQKSFGEEISERVLIPDDVMSEYKDFAKECLKLRERHNKEWMKFLKKYEFGGRIDIVYRDVSGVGLKKKCNHCDCSI